MRRWQVTFIDKNGNLSRLVFKSRSAALALLYGQYFCDQNQHKLCGFCRR